MICAIPSKRGTKREFLTRIRAKILDPFGILYRFVFKMETEAAARS